MKKRRNYKGVFSIVLGLLLIVGAFALAIYNIKTDTTAGELADTRLEELQTVIETNARTKQASENTGYARQELSPEPTPIPEMPTEEIKGDKYIGMLEIPSAEMSLPILAEWNFKKLNTAPCLYLGSYFSDNMVIAAHNYQHHFRPLQHIETGTDVYFITVDGVVYHYIVESVETLYKNEGAKLREGDWDLTLFTCWPGGGSRCVVRCYRV